MTFNCAVTVLIISAISLCQATSGQDDLIDSLPGLASKPSFKQYSGYLQASGTRKLHYWFVESQSNPSKDPVVVWFNGGPGCSSMDGLLKEHGPFKMNDDAVTLDVNPYSWNLVANMIYVDAPAGVGFSYSDDKNYTTNDVETAANNLAALKSFFKKFPQFKVNDFYITGESYAGVYVPTLASDMIDDGDINLKGFAVGNGLSDKTMNDNSAVYFAYNHGLFGESLLHSLNESCCSGNFGHCNFVKNAKTSAICNSYMQDVQQLIWSSGLDPYNLYDDCALGTTSLHYDKDIGKIVSPHIMRPFDFLPKSIEERKFLKSLPKGAYSSDPPCADAGPVTKYLNSPAVRAALHIPSVVQPWALCSVFTYVQQYDRVQPLYIKALSSKLRILVYNGDVDMACNFLGGEWFVDSLPLQNAKSRKMWYFTIKDAKFVAGFIKVYDQLTFVTVKGSGHLVPLNKPIPALEMFTNFIQDKPFKV